MRVLHATGKITPSKGQVMQLEGEIQAAKQLGIPWDTKIFCPKGNIVNSSSVQFSEKISVTDYKSFFQKVLIWPRFRKDFYNWVKSQEEFYDVILLRYNFHDPYQWLYLKTAKRPVYLVHHTKEIEELKSENGLIGFMRATLERILGKKSLQHAYGSIGVTSEIANYEKNRSGNHNLKLATYPNGINTASIDLIPKETSSDMNILFVAGMFAPWHGVDLLLSAMQKYSGKFKLHLIGRLEDKDLELAKLDDRVIIHGVMSRDDIPGIAKICHIGIGSLAMHRAGLQQTSSLKTREYLALGLPVFSNCMDVFHEDFKYYKIAEPNIDNILNYAEEMKDVSRKEVHDAAKQFIDKKYILKDTYDVIARQVKNA